MSVQLYDVLAVNIKTSRVRLLSERTDEENAEAIVKMAIMRRGVETEFYVVKPGGEYQEGDKIGKPNRRTVAP